MKTYQSILHKGVCTKKSLKSVWALWKNLAQELSNSKTLYHGKNSFKVFDLKLHKLNEAYIKFECERSLAQELSDYFTFFVPGYQFTPAFKSRVWDGKIRLADLRNFTIYHGLVPYIEKFCKDRDYTIDIEPSISSTENYSLVEANEFITSLKKKIELKILF